MKKTIELTVDIPDWANWLAVDSGGAVYVYREKPIQKFGCWDLPSIKYNDDESFEEIGRVVSFPKNWDWSKTLRRLKDYR